MLRCRALMLLVVLEGRLVRDGQVVRPVYAVGLGDVHHLEYQRVGVLHLVAEEARRVDIEVIALAVADKRPAVAVVYVAARGDDRLVGDVAVLALVRVRRALKYLKFIERAGAQRDKQGDYQPEGGHPAGFILLPIGRPFQRKCGVYIFFLPIARQG